MAHCYARSSVAARADAASSRDTGPCTRRVAPHSTQGRKLHPANTQTLRAQLSLGSLERHWRSRACPDFVWVKTGFRQRGGGAPAAHDCGLDEEIAHGQLGFELLTPAFPGSTAWWPRGSTSKQEAVFQWTGGLVLSGSPWHDYPVARLPRGDWRWSSSEGSGEAKLRNNICIGGLSVHIAECTGMGNATDTFLNCKKKNLFNFKTLRLQNDLPKVGALIRTKLGVKLARSTVNNAIDLRWDTMKYDLLWSWEIHGSKSNQTYHQSVFEEESSLLRLATDNIYTLKSHV